MDVRLCERFRKLEEEIDTLQERVKVLEEQVTPRQPPNKPQRFHDEFVLVHE
jgi:hypothetical protein